MPARPGSGLPAAEAASGTMVAAVATQSRRWAPWIACTYLGIAFLLSLVASLGAQNPIGGLPGARGETGVPFLDAWFRYDSGWYAFIANDGYFFREGEQSAVAFFPTYPLTMRAVDVVVGNVALAGVVVTLIAGAAGVVLFWRWSRRWLSARSALLAVVLLLVYPYSLYLYGAIYADALFLLTAVGAFLLLERGHPWLAGLVGALATAGRPVGLAVAVGLIIRAVELSAARQRAAEGQPERGAVSTGGLMAPARHIARTSLDAVRTFQLRDSGVLLSLLGLAGWSGYLAWEFGHPLAFIEAQENWDQASGPRTWAKVEFFGALVHQPWDTKLKLLLPALLCLVGLLLVRRIHRRFGWGYAAYCFLMIVVPALSTKDFMGTGRYLIAAFPVFAIAGELLDESPRRALRPIVVGFSASLLVLGAYLYGTAYQVS